MENWIQSFLVFYIFTAAHKEVDHVCSSSRSEMTRIRYNLTRIRDKKRNFVLCEFQNRNSNTLFSLNSLNLFHFTYYLL